MTTHFHLLLVFSVLASVLTLNLAAVPPRDALGIAPEDEAYYRGEVLRCRDGSKKFTRDQLNDDFCDCADGTDEPGTSACPEGRFHCRNVGHLPLTIFSSRVNDGICDCCDGSDEYGGQTSCENTCWEAGKEARKNLKKKIATFQSGVVLRAEEVSKAKQAFAKDEADISKLKTEAKFLQELVDKLKEQKDRIEKAEEEERKQREKELKDQKAEKEAKEEEKAQDDSADEDAEDETIDDQSKSKDATDGQLDNDDGHDKGDKWSEVEVAEEGHGSESEGLSKEELGRLVASRWTGEKGDVGKNEEYNAGEPDLPDPSKDENFDDDKDFEDEEYEDDFSESSDSHLNDEPMDTKDSDLEAPESLSWLGKIRQIARSSIQQFNFFKTPVDLSEASRIRKEYDDASSKLSKIRSRISSLSEKIKHDFGKDKEFYSFYDECFENKAGKYVYKVCPYKKAYQVEGHSSTQLGRWDKFEESYRVMHFGNGDRCWNGPDRSLKVRLRCGLKNELTDVDEPSRCEYVAVLSTPVLCHEHKLKELQQKLEGIKGSQPESHDEL